MGATNGIILVDKRLRVLCVHPTDSPTTVWSIPKGGEEEGETSFEAAIRELKEETNLNLEDFVRKITYYEFVGCFPYGSRNKKLMAHIVYVDEALSKKTELELKCITKIDGSDKLECDIIEWKDLSFALRCLHHTQITALSKVVKKLVKINSKKFAL